MMSSKGAKSVSRALGKMENVFVDLMELTGFGTIVYCLMMSIKYELVDYAMLTSLKNWRKIYPMLRMSVVERDGEKYFEERQNDDVDYKRILGGDWLAIYHELLHTKYSKSGPMWRVRLVPQHGADDTDPAKPYKYAVIISWMHGITDGVSNICTCNRLAELIDMIIDGSTESYGDEAELKPPREVLLPQMEYSWTEVLPLLKRMLKRKSSTIWGQIFKANKETKSTMRFVDMGALTAEETASLSRRCKHEKVTVNSVLVNAACRAIYAELEKGGADGEALSLLNGHSVSLRRYWEPSQNVYGYYVGKLNVPCVVSEQEDEDFWPSARATGDDIIEALNKGDLQKEVLTVQYLLDAESFVVKMADEPVTIFDACFSNLRDVSQMFPGEYNNVDVTWLCRSTCLRCNGVPMLFNFITFRSRLLCSMDFDTWFCSAEQAAAIAKQTMKVLRSAISN